MSGAYVLAYSQDNNGKETFQQDKETFPQDGENLQPSSHKPLIDWAAIQAWSAKLGGVRLTAIRNKNEIEFVKGLDRAEIQRLQDEGYRVYFEINPCGYSKRCDANIERIREIGIDLDAKLIEPETLELEKVTRAIAALDLPQPTINVTKNGFHLHWLLEADSISKDDYKAVAERIAKGLPGGDPAVTSPCELLKLPGCWDVKDINDPFLIRTVQTGEVVGKAFIAAAMLLPAPSKAVKVAKPAKASKVAKPAAAAAPTAAKITAKSTDSEISEYIASAVTGKRDRLYKAAFIMGKRIHAGKTSHDETIELLIGALKSDAAVNASVEDWELANTTAIEGIDAGLKAAETKQAGNAGRYPIPAKVAHLLRRDEDGRPPSKLHPLDVIEFTRLQFEGRCRLNRRNLKVQLDGKEFNEDSLFCELMADAMRWGYKVPDAEKYVRSLAAQNMFDPWLDYWEALPLMPAEDVAPMVTDVLGALHWPDEVLSWHYFYQFLLDFSRRIKHPGCIQRRVLVLISETEEIGKSSFFNNITKMSWEGNENSLYTVSGGRPDSQFTEDAQMRTAVVRELSELDGITRKADQANLKGWIAAPNDSMRKFHSAEMEEVPRAGIICSTGNKKESLPPDDENSRFMVVELSKKFNWEWLNDGGFRKIQMLSKAIYIHGQRANRHFNDPDFNTFSLSEKQQAEQIVRNRGHILASGSEDEAQRLVGWIKSNSTWFDETEREHVGFTLEELLRFGCDQKNANQMQKSALKRAFRGLTDEGGQWDVKQFNSATLKGHFLRKDGFKIRRATPGDLTALEGLLTSRSV